MASRIIDGNQIVNDNLARRAQPGQYGMVNNARTGEVLAEIAREGAPDMGRSAFTPTMADVGLLKEQNQQERLAQEELALIRDKEQYEGGMPMVDDADIAGDSFFEVPTNDQELNADKEAMMFDMGKVSNYMEENGIDFNEVIKNLNPAHGFSEYGIDFLKDPRNITSGEEAQDAGMTLDAILDAMNIDTELFFKDGTMVECDAGCQEMRDLQKVQAQENESQMISEGDQPLSMSDGVFKERVKELQNL